MIDELKSDWNTFVLCDSSGKETRKIRLLTNDKARELNKQLEKQGSGERWRKKSINIQDLHKY